jgi:hypothetical protein
MEHRMMDGVLSNVMNVLELAESTPGHQSKEFLDGYFVPFRKFHNWLDLRSIILQVR